MQNESNPAPIAAESLAQEAVALAAQLLVAANAQQVEAERRQAQKIAGMMEDPAGKELTIALIDQAFRSHRPARIADQLAYLLDRYGPPGYMEWWERVGLVVGGVMGQYMPSLVVPPIMMRLRQETRYVILPAEEEELRAYLEKRRQSGVRLNLNLLGEAILGESEAKRRLDGYLALLGRDDVEYISIKISSMCSQLNPIAFEETLVTVKERLRLLYRQALASYYRHADGRVTPKFVNLDMEEYRDLHLTVAAFQAVLDEPEFAQLSAGLALQAYLPSSYIIQQQLTAWAMQRQRRGGAPVKLRIVKGANLAMERVDASLHGWPQAPYTTKAEVDANFKRMVTYGVLPTHAEAVHLGVASHNLFDIAYSLLLRRAYKVEPYVEFEMLEGMANHQARAVQERAGGLLLYAPVVKADDFHSAIAYLVRRLDENTAPENFLHDLFGLEVGSAAWNKQRDHFLQAVAQQQTVSDRPRRTQNRATEKPHPAHDAPFANEPDTDWSLPANCAWVREVMERWRQAEPEQVPLQIGGEEIYTEQMVEGVDPSRPNVVAYRHALADGALVERALRVAVASQVEWAAQPVDERRRLLIEVAAELARCRGDLIGAMIVDGAKTVSEADPEVSEAVDFARYYAHALDLDDEVAGCRLEPFGVVVVTPPWNFPLSIPAGGVLAALMAGNAVILKPAPEAVLVSWHLVKALWAAGIPKRVLQFVPAPDNEVGQMLITDPRTAAVILTGSIETAQLFLGWRPDLRLCRDERQEQPHHHRHVRPRPGDQRLGTVGLWPQRPKMLGGEPGDLRSGSL
jgi:RHH-type proline utilization regulon transcriptional repressor/proline dehydrogenase/delta 1-pyrroline-5-carboxylate dehydrogenase